MPYTPREVAERLINKFGFAEATGHGSDHRYLRLQLPGLPPILTRVSHNKKDIPPTIEKLIARQVRVRGQFFKGMIDCRNSREDYYQKLHDAPYPPWDVRIR